MITEPPRQPREEELPGDRARPEAAARGDLRGREGHHGVRPAAGPAVLDRRSALHHARRLHPQGRRQVLRRAERRRPAEAEDQRRSTRTRWARRTASKEYIQDKLRSAQWLIRSIQQRQRTIIKVAESIMKFQREFFDKGIAHLKPLILRDVAEDIGMHESTVSRVTTNKYVHTPQGIFELKFFFNSGISRTNGEELASQAVKSKIKELVAAEDAKRPHSRSEDRRAAQEGRHRHRAPHGREVPRAARDPELVQAQAGVLTDGYRGSSCPAAYSVAWSDSRGRAVHQGVRTTAPNAARSCSRTRARSTSTRSRSSWSGLVHRDARTRRRRGSISRIDSIARRRWSRCRSRAPAGQPRASAGEHTARSWRPSPTSAPCSMCSTSSVRRPSPATSPPRATSPNACESSSNRSP